MQSSSSIGDFSTAPSKHNIELETHFDTFMKQDKIYDATPVNKKLLSNVDSTQRPGVATSFLYKLTEIAAYTSAVATEAYQTLTAGGVGKVEAEISIKANRKSRRGYSQYLDDDIMQINADNSDDNYINDDELSDSEIAQSSSDNNGPTDCKRHDKKGQCSWAANDDDEEPPPPYDSSWRVPAPSNNNNDDVIPAISITTQNLTNKSVMTSSPKQIQFATPQSDQMPQTSSPIDISSTTPPTPAKRRQIRVRRPRRPLRRKSSSTDIQSQSRGYEDQDEMLLKVNEKLSDMIVQGRAALNSTVDVTEVEMMLAEEKDREDRIMKELGLQTPVGRRGRRTTGSSSDYDYFSGSLSDSGSYSAPESSYCDYGYGAGNSYASPDGYTTPNRCTPSIHYNSPVYGSCASPAGYNHSMLGSGISQGGGYGKPSTEFSAPLPNRHHSVPAPTSIGHGDIISCGHSNSTIPGCNGSPSGKYGGAQQNGFGGTLSSVGGLYGSNPSGFGPYVGLYGPNVGGYLPKTGGAPAPNANGYGSNVGFSSNGMYNNREFLY